MKKIVEKYCPICHNEMEFVTLLGFLHPDWHCFQCEHFEDYQDYEQISDDRENS